MTTKLPHSLKLSKAFMALAELAKRLEVESIKDLTGCWEHQIDDHWWVAVNGHDSAVKCSKGVKVLPFHAYVEFNGWPAGAFSPLGGVIAAGKAANEATFTAAVRAAAKAPRPQVAPGPRAT